ncbi:hypothetical protein EDD17DRAFT_1590928 [Pisolithus thermaeus]|nr:hypothetical protein EV401DRAFT_1981880 [Pisolithus croceorrhizus]KAI6161251.1 hypothetical protein EDD17DRAFT_1590928 [Pisolithus thermaeus]
MRQWFDMMVWLEGDIPRNLEIGYEPCVRCRSLLKSRYEGLAANCTVTSHVSLLDAICNIGRCSRTPRSSSSPGPTANLLVNRMLEPLMRQHDFDVRYLPSVNRYPTPLRQYVAKPLRPQRYSRRVKFTDKMFDGVHDPWVVLGIVALATCRAPAGKGTDSHNGKRHSYFSSFLRHSLECFDMPVLPQLSSTGLMLCHTLDQDCFEEYSFGHAHRAIDDDSGWVKSDQDGRQLRLSTAVMVAVTTFLHNKDVGLYGCRRCRNICMESFAGTSSTVWFGVANSRERAGLGPSSAHIRGEDDVLGGDHPSVFQGSLDIAMQEPAGMEAFTTYLRDPTLSKDEVQLQMVAGFLKLRQYIESYGLDASDCFHRSDGDSRPRLEHVPGHGTSSSKLSKSDKVEVIKGKLLEMLRELNLPSERLPWYTLEKDLEKHGCALINWPAEVLRKRGNRGIHDLSAVEVNTLYEAITCPDELRRLHICRRPSTLTVVSAQQVDHTSVAASGSKRPLEDLRGHSSKRIRFKDMTSKVSQQRLSDPRADGTAES